MVCQLVSCPSNVIRVMATNSNCLKWLHFAGKLEEFFKYLRIFRRSQKGVMSKLRIKWTATKPSGIDRLYLPVQQLAFVMTWWMLIVWTMASPHEKRWWEGSAPMKHELLPVLSRNWHAWIWEKTKEYNLSRSHTKFIAAILKGLRAQYEHFIVQEVSDVFWVNTEMLKRMLN